MLKKKNILQKMVHGGRGDLMAHAQKLAEPELKQEQGLVTTLLLLVMAPHVQDPQVKTQIVTLNPVQVMNTIFFKLLIIGVFFGLFLRGYPKYDVFFLFLKYQ